MLVNLFICVAFLIIFYSVVDQKFLNGRFSCLETLKNLLFRPSIKVLRIIFKGSFTAIVWLFRKFLELSRNIYRKYDLYIQCGYCGDRRPAIQVKNCTSCGGKSVGSVYAPCKICLADAPPYISCVNCGYAINITRYSTTPKK